MKLKKLDAKQAQAALNHDEVGSVVVQSVAEIIISVEIKYKDGKTLRIAPRGGTIIALEVEEIL